ncbi:DUF2188 domain-containing protein [Kineosporia sp. J2-2]|uniref:DUF2188 domain-containing protein n=1 Tax=Kineosporia corallincola TaxID=2835133 RepID=A0ABS5TFW0_9ACTN|nr:DUF2188 domain-containing protein [Kineosporia corallincola]MBT0769076.1 DUF2188 domain-containing protein [Kineosporia corallincola]
MPKGDVETYHQDGNWHSRIEGQTAPFATGGTKDEQVGQGRDRARADRVEHIVKDQNGQITEKHTYGDDPRDIPG